MQVENVEDNQGNYQGYQHDVQFIQCHTFTVIHFMDGEGVC